ncbi:hypothetical protein NLJ89_g11540 [Agrocybe chaxingu]|uniref:Uncharacterized protein n=1 Tax=Agrocybe chaxingu TaxID=84603 RepID=A0A9W8JPT5_9AGAR|nr:hypothetical protein NLJ89_g11540 [Agrocybe chaxingu]
MPTSKSNTIRVKLDVLEVLLQTHGEPKASTSERSDALLKDSKVIVAELIACREVAKAIKPWARQIARTIRSELDPFIESTLLSDKVKDEIENFICNVEAVEEFPLSDLIKEHEAQLAEYLEAVNRVNKGDRIRKNDRPPGSPKRKILLAPEFRKPFSEAINDKAASSDDDDANKDEWVPIWDGKVKRTSEKSGR